MPVAIVGQRRRPRSHRQQHVGRLQQLKCAPAARRRSCTADCRASSHGRPRPRAAPKRRCQSASLSSATPAAPARSSSARRRRPTPATTPSAGSSDAVTIFAGHALGLGVAGQRHRQAANAPRRRRTNGSDRASRRSSASSWSASGTVPVRSMSRTSRSGVAKRQRPQQHGVHDREDRRVRADAERERQDGDGESPAATPGRGWRSGHRAYAPIIVHRVEFAPPPWRTSSDRPPIAQDDQRIHDAGAPVRSSLRAAPRRSHAGCSTVVTTA